MKCQMSKSHNQKPKDRNISSSRALNHPHEVQRSQQAEDPAEVRTYLQKPFQADNKVMTSSVYISRN